MADAIIELVQVLRSKDAQGRITRQEADILDGCKSRAVKGFTIGGSVASGLVWIATRNLNTFVRVSFAGGAAFTTGMWRLKESMDSCVNHILAMDGSRMQHELRKIVLERYGNNPQRMQAFSKHFYLEEVFSDSTLEHPKTVYRQRNIYMDVERIANSDTYGVLDSDKTDVYHQHRNEDPNLLKVKRPTADIKQARINLGIHIAGYEDPLDNLFGYSLANEESHQPDNSSVSTKMQSRSQKRAQRKHKLRHRHRDSLSLEE